MSDNEIKKPKEVDLKSVFSDVLKGYTVIKSDILKESFAYIKHLNIYDNVQTDKLYDKCLKKAKKQGLPTEESQLEYLNKEGVWTKAQDDEVAQLSLFINNLRDTRSKLFLKSQIEPVLEEIEKNEIKLYELESEKIEAIGYTAEKYAAKRANEIYIQKAVYKDEEFKERSISLEDFEHVTDKELNQLTVDYNTATRFVTLANIKKISLLPFFCNYFYLCDDNPQIFYGKPVVSLTFFQAELFAFGRYFKNIVQESKAQPPDDIKNDPDKLVEFYEMRKNAEEVMEKLEARTGEKAGASSLVGATPEDLEAIGYKKSSGQTVTLSEVASKKGGNLSMDDFIDLHG